MKINIKKKNWQLIKLGEVLKKTEDNDKENAKNRYQKFLKVEHLDAKCLHVKRWGEHGKEELPPTFFKIFKKGQILFPTRNPHLKRAAFVHFDGICGEKTLTLDPMDLLVDPKFIPFLFHSKKFYDHSTSAIIGSTNPHVRWRDIAEFEFLLPPKEEQAKLAKLLWAADNVVEKDKALLERLEVGYQNLADNYFSTSLKNNYKKVSEIASVNINSLSNSTDPNYKFKYLDISSILKPKTIGELNWISFSDAPSRARRVVNDGDIVLSLVRPYQKSFVFIENAKDIIASTGTGVITTNKDINSKFIFHQFFTKRFTAYCETNMAGTNYPAITPNDLKNYEIVFIDDKNKQNEIANKLDHFDIAIENVESKLQSSQALLKSLINEVFV